MSFPFTVFERAIFSQLREIDPRSILDGTNGHDAVMELSGELGEVESRIAEIEAELEHGNIAALARKLRELEGRQKKLVEELQAERDKAANPLSAAWGEACGLLDVLDANDGPDVRLRLRATLRRIVESVWLLVVPVKKSRDRLCAVQIFFAGGERHRDYLIFHQPPVANAKSRTEGASWARSLASIIDPAKLDLRQREDAAALEEVLAELDLADLESTGG